jgi:hypothetical protein
VKLHSSNSAFALSLPYNPTEDRDAMRENWLKRTSSFAI